MSQTPRKLRDFLESFVDDNALVDGDELLLDVTPEEVQELGFFFVRGIRGWIHGLNRERYQRQSDINLGRVEETSEAVEEESELTH